MEQIAGPGAACGGDARNFSQIAWKHANLIDLMVKVQSMQKVRDES
jgi:hypothetical protein